MTTAARVERLTQAGEWLLRLNEPARSERDVDEWVEWCAASAENLEAFEQVQRDWHDLDALKSSSPTALQGGGGRGAVGSFPFFRLAASLAAIFLTASIAFYFWPSGVSVDQLAASTINKSATLPDGSSVVLGAQTKVNIDFTGTGRDLALSQGEAYFQVRKDRRRPFVVHAGDVSVTAIGTAFNVRRAADSIVVTVEEGTIELSSSPPLLPQGGEGRGEESSPSSRWRAQAGHQLTYSLSTRTTTLAAVDPAMFLKWRDGELAYMWEPLGAVIADVNRYSRRRIVLEDESLTSFRFTGTVFTDAIDDWLEAIQGAYPVRVEYSPAGEVRLHSTAPVQKLP